MLALSWQKWTDPIVDFGRELYVAWRIAEGERLYVDIQYFSGPISPHINALLIRIFGLHLMTLAWANVLLFAFICIGLYRLGRKVSNPTGTAIALIGVITVCGFARLTHRANFNFITPYSHELTHAIALAVVSLLMLDAWLRSPKRAWLCGIGVCLGISLLMKPEVAIALGSAMAAGLLLAKRKFVLPDLCILIALTLSVPLLSLAIGGKSSLGAFRFIFDDRISDLPFYQKLMGIDEVGKNLRASVLNAAILATPVALTWRWTRASRWKTSVSNRLVLAVLFATMMIATSVAFTGSMIAACESFWMQLPRALTILAPIAALVLVKRASKLKDPSAILIAAVGVFATMLLIKMGLNIRFGHYGFALALPALFVSGLLLSMARRNAPLAIVSNSLFIAIIISHVWMTIAYLNLQTMTIDSPIATLRTNPNLDINRINHDAKRVLQRLSEIASPQDSLAVVPEGVMLNVMSERRNPTGAIVLLPVELFMFGEDDVLKRFEQHPPDWLVINVETIGSEFGAGDLAHMPRVSEFFARNYRLIEGEPSVGLRIFRRNFDGR